MSPFSLSIVLAKDSKDNNMVQIWKSYEEVAEYLLNQFADEFGISRVEGKQVVKGRQSGTQWEIDAKGVREGKEGFIIVECRRYVKSKQSQEKLASLAYRIIDTGAEGGILVSPLGLQKGAQKIAASSNIIDVRLNPNSTVQDFAMQFLNKIMISKGDPIRLSDSADVKTFGPCRSSSDQFKPNKDEH